jgi:hypothetical protein
VAYRLRLNDWNGVQAVELELIGVRLSEGKTAGSEPTGKNTQPVAVSQLEQTDEPQLKSPQLELPQSKPPQSKSSQSMARRSKSLARSIAHPIEPSLLRTSTAQEASEENLPAVAEPEPGLGAEEVRSIDDAADTSLNMTSAKPNAPSRIEFYYNKRKYTCGILQVGDNHELRIRNWEGQVLTVQPQQRRGLLGKRRDDAREIDVSHPHYFNLIRAALSALDLTEKMLLIQAKDQLLAAKDQQIEMLNQQLQMLDRQLNQLSQEQQQQFQTLQSELQQRQTLVQNHETQIVQLQQQLSQHKPPLKPEDIKRQARTQLGDSVWKSLNPHSQKDLASALKHYYSIQSETFTASVADYSEAGLRLGFAVEREVIQPFFRQLHQFLLNNGGSDEIAGVTLRPRKRYTLGMLPPLLSSQWYSFRETILTTCTQLPEEDFYCTIKFDQVNQPDRDRVNAFLNQWDHAVAHWLLKHKVAAASAIDQINKLRNIAAHAENSLYQWQYDLMQILVMGGETQFGIFQDIYGTL